METLKRIKPFVLFCLTGIAFYFSRIATTFQLIGSASVLTGSSYASLMVAVAITTVILSALIAKLVLRVAFRIAGAVFTKESGRLFPFPIHYGEFTSICLLFAIPCLLLCGATEIPVLFFPTFMRVASAIRSVVIWVFLALGALYFMRRYAHDYDKKSLAVSLSVVPLFIVGITLALTIVEIAL